jgi:hypothetical protein
MFQYPMLMLNIHRLLKNVKKHTLTSFGWDKQSNPVGFYIRWIWKINYFWDKVSLCNPTWPCTSSPHASAPWTIFMTLALRDTLVRIMSHLHSHPNIYLYRYRQRYNSDFSTYPLQLVLILADINDSVISKIQV